MTQTITAVARNINNAFTITEIATSIANSDSGRLIHQVTATEGAQFQGTWRDIYRRWDGDSANAGAAISPTIGGGSGGTSVTDSSDPWYTLGLIETL
jgi:hypothetical protein